MLKTGKVIHEMLSEGLFNSVFPVIQNWNLHYSHTALQCINAEYIAFTPQTNHISLSLQPATGLKHLERNVV